MTFFLKKPFMYTRDLRKILLKELSFKKLTINEGLRTYSKNPVGALISLQDLVDHIRLTLGAKRESIPPKQLYLKHVVLYWSLNPKGTHTQCVKLWNSKPKTQKKYLA